MISVIIPVFNEKESLPDLLKELSVNLNAYKKWEVIFIDDGSSDGSTELLVESCKENKHFKLIQFYRNFGKSAALNEGFKMASGDYVITMDADLQDSPDEIPELYAMIKKDGYHLVSGYKEKRYDPYLKLFLQNYSILPPGCYQVLI